MVSFQGTKRPPRYYQSNVNKRGLVVIQDVTREAESQLSNKEHYKALDSDPKKSI